MQSDSQHQLSPPRENLYAADGHPTGSISCPRIALAPGAGLLTQKANEHKTYTGTVFRRAGRFFRQTGSGFRLTPDRSE